MRVLAENALDWLAGDLPSPATVPTDAGRSAMAKIRTVEHIDADLAKVVDRRTACRRQIGVLSSSIVNDTREIDRLLAERSDCCTAVLAEALLAVTGD